MTISEFFLKQTLKQMRERFKAAKLNKYYDFPQNIDECCSMLGLENDGIITSFFVIKRWSQAKIYIGCSLPNPQFPECPLNFDIEFGAESGSSACKFSRRRSMNSVDSLTVFHKVSDFFDERPNHNNIECRVNMSNLVDVNETFEDLEGKTRYRLRNDKTIWDLYMSVCRQIEILAPQIRMFVESTENGKWEKIWDFLFPTQKWQRGNEKFKAMFLPNIMNQWCRVVKAGLKPNIENFVKYFIATNCCHIGDDTKMSLLYNWNTKDDEAIDSFKSILLEFDKNYLLWNNKYKEANKQLMESFEKLRNELAVQHGINPKYLDSVITFPKTKDNHWWRTDVPDDAYDIPTLINNI